MKKNLLFSFLSATNGTQTHNLVLGEQNFIPLNYGGGAELCSEEHCKEYRCPKDYAV